ncbi:MICOS complex subunit MIC60 [Frankliniella fusca]|uniref:MICOS complex subunit MIC60 n=1 Tax=Frankliniella fusca TaxID=407009 RepID=A0AAE1LJV4_9NEOP|nr:MICOS complex subunit MIC60 [Frankliniella fusca]
MERMQLSSEVLLPQEGNVLLSMPCLANDIPFQNFLKVSFGRTVLQINRRDSCFRTTDGEIVVLQSITLDHEGAVHLAGKVFLQKADFFQYPLPSSQLGIFSVSNLSNDLRLFSVADVAAKCWLMPDDEKFCCFVVVKFLPVNPETEDEPSYDIGLTKWIKERDGEFGTIFWPTKAVSTCLKAKANPDPATWTLLNVKFKRFKATWDDAVAYTRNVVNHSSNYETETEMGRGRRRKVPTRQFDDDLESPKRPHIKTSKKQFPSCPAVAVPKNLLSNLPSSLKRTNNVEIKTRKHAMKVASKVKSSEASKATFVHKLESSRISAQSVAPSKTFSPVVSNPPSKSSQSSKDIFAERLETSRTPTQSSGTSEPLSPVVSNTPSKPSQSSKDIFAKRLETSRTSAQSCVTSEPLSPVVSNTPNKSSQSRHLHNLVTSEPLPPVVSNTPNKSSQSSKDIFAKRLETSRESAKSSATCEPLSSVLANAPSKSSSQSKKEIFAGKFENSRTSAKSSATSEPLSPSNSNQSSNDIGLRRLPDKPLSLRRSSDSGIHYIDTEDQLSDVSSGVSRQEQVETASHSVTDAHLEGRGQEKECDFSLNKFNLENRLADLVEVKKCVRSNSSKLDELSINMARVIRCLMPGEKATSLPPGMPPLPLDNLDAMDLFSNWVVKPHNKDAVVEYLSKLPIVGDEYHTAMTMMTYVMSNHLASYYNFSGKTFKLPLKETQLWTAVKGALAVIFKTSVLTDAARGIKAWLKDAPKRSGGITITPSAAD